MLKRFLVETDVRRAGACLATLQRHGTESWALTGSVAAELRLIERGNQVDLRSLQDLDFVTPAFDTVPTTLGTDFLVRHVHPLDPPDKMIAQFVSSELTLRVDVFRTYPEVMSRAHPVLTEFGAIQALSIEDLVARAARLSWPLVDRHPVLSKHVRDFLRLMKAANVEDVERAWPQHRRVGDPESFRNAAEVLLEVIPKSADLLESPTYSQNCSETCPRCAAVEGLELTNQEEILSVLGYC